MLCVSFSWGDLNVGDSTCRFRRIGMHEGDFNGRALTEQELAQLNRDFDGYAFCTTAYACPEEIDWTQVCYNGAGISEEPPARILQAYLDAGGWGELDIEAIQDYRLREFVWKNTLTSYDLADTTLWLHWFDEDGWYIFEHGDTNIVSVDFYEGYVDGELYKLRYTRPDWEHYRFGAEPFVLTAYIRDGEWQYVSNLPARWPEPQPLVTLRYYDTLEDAQAVNNVVDTASLEQTEWMEPFGWSYAVFTAQTDGVRYILETVDDYTDEGLDVTIPADYVASGVLNAGESAAVYTNRPWHAALRLTVTGGSFYGSYVFGEDNWKHLYDDDARTILGRDLAGEGRGCTPESEEELSAFLCDGSWALLDRDTAGVVGSVSFHDYRLMNLRSMDFSADAFLDFDRYDARPQQAPDMICLKYSEESGYSWGIDGVGEGEPIGDYRLYMVQLDGEQVLSLRFVGEGRNILGELFPEADEGGSFTLHRYKGTAELEGQG